MKGIILGSGTGIPSLSRNAAGYHLEAGGQQFLIDCGPGTLRRMERARKGYVQLDAVLITHVHPDHVSDLTPLMHAFRLPGMDRSKPLTLYGPKGFKDFFENIVAPMVRPPERFPFSVVEAEESWTIGQVTLHTFPTTHAKNLASIAYRIEENGRSVVFSGDCDYSQTLIDGARNADLLILDCATLDSGKMEGHLSAGLAGLVAAKAGVAHLIPTHFYPIPAADSFRQQECAIQYSGKITLAEDLMEFEV